MTMADIDRIYTEKVSELLAQGYQIYTSTMGGSQGEIAHTDLSNGSEILRVLLEQKTDFVTEYGDYFSIQVGRNTDPLHRNGGGIIWNEHLETLSEIKLLKVTDKYITTMDEAAVISEKRFARWKNSARARSSRRELPDAYKSAALRWVRKQPRMKTCRLDEIESVTRVNKTDWGKNLPDLQGYEIKAKGHTFMLKPPAKG